MFYDTSHSLGDQTVHVSLLSHELLSPKVIFVNIFCVLSNLFSCCEICGKQRSDMILVTLKRV